jgi:hypothetical protein
MRLEDTTVGLSFAPSLLQGAGYMDRGAGECWNDRQGFGVHSVTQELSAYNKIRVSNIIKLFFFHIIYFYSYKIIMFLLLLFYC